MNNFRQIKELFNFEKGTLQSSKCISGEYDFITASSEWKKNDKYTHNQEAIVIAVAAAGSLGRVHYVNGKFIASDLCFILTPKDSINTPVDLNLYSHIFNITKDDLVKKTATGTSKLSINKTNFGNYLIPYFDVEKQEKYKNKLLTINNKKNKIINELNKQKIIIDNIRRSILNSLIDKKTSFIQLDDLCNFDKGISPIQKTNPGQYVLVTTADERKSSDTYQFNNKAVCIPLVSSTGHGKKSLNYIHYQEGKFALGSILVALTAKDENILNMKFLHQYLLLNKDNIIIPLMKGMANVTLPIKELKKIKLPLLDIKEQNKFEILIDKLDKFEKKMVENTKNINCLMNSALQETFVDKNL